MTGKAAALQGGLAALGLITAHLTWQREPERAPGEVTVIDAGKNDLGKVHFEDETTSIDLERKQEGGEPGVWLHLVDKPKAPPTPPKDPKKPEAAKAEAANTSEPTPTPPAATPPVTPPRDLRGSDVATKLLDQLAPLRSPRAFGILDAAKLKELGLEGSKRKLTITAKGDTREYTIGQPRGQRDPRGVHARQPRRPRLPDAARRARRSDGVDPPRRQEAARLRADRVRPSVAHRRRQEPRAGPDPPREHPGRAAGVAEVARQARSDGQELARSALAVVRDGGPRPGRGAQGGRADAGRARSSTSTARSRWGTSSSPSRRRTRPSRPTPRATVRRCMHAPKGRQAGSSCT